MASIELNNVSVSIPIYNASSRALKSELFRRAVGGNIDVSKHNVAVIHALENVSFCLAHGDRVALVGGNGAGKTTLLRVISRIYPPSAGHAHIIGRISSLIDFAVGMDLEATGYENIIMRGIILGLSSSEAKALIPEIEEFTELGEYLRLPVRTYSAGMMLRLAFGISTAVQPEILVLDEVINTGDARFIEKARSRIERLISGSSIMVMASHDLDLVRRLCPVSIWMNRGRVAAIGKTANVLDEYHASLVADAPAMGTSISL